jgi:peptidoglycan/xylan/chitin deacetylase (PgdA/CDA1 family)
MMQKGLSALRVSGVGTMLAPLTRGKGVIFTLHNVRPEPPQAFEPNRILKVTPDFLDAAIETVQRAGYDVVSLDEAARRFKADAPARPFACFTFDDGYRDNRDYAYPIFKQRNLPFAIYVPTAYPDGEGDLWWLVLEDAIRKADRVRVPLDGVEREFDTSSAEKKNAAFDAIYWSLRPGSESELRAAVRRIAEDVGCDTASLCRELIMNWDELRALAADPLVTIGAHTRGHFAVAKLPEEEARAEISGSVQRIERELGRPCRHFSFPYGDAASAGPRDFAIAASLGLETAVTTHKDVLRDKYAMTGLPRVSLNGDFQDPAYVEAMITGVPFLLFDGAKAAIKRLNSLRGARAGEVPAPSETTRPDAASI